MIGADLGPSSCSGDGGKLGEEPMSILFMAMSLVLHTKVFADKECRQTRQNVDEKVVAHQSFHE